MPKPAARKTSRPPRAPKRGAIPKPKKGGECSACGLIGGHQNGCPNGSCAECGLMAGSHTLDCSHHPAIERDEPTLSGTHGNVVEDDASDEDVVDAEFDADVDGKSARVKVTKPRRESSAPKPELTRLPPPRLKNAAAAVYAIQRALDDKEIFGIHQALTKTEQCSYEWFDEKSQQSVGCFAAAVFDFEDVETCPTCNKTSKNIKEPLCLVHMGMRQMDELPARQTDMFDHDEHGDPEPE